MQQEIDIHSFVDKIYCINLDRREDRWRECLGKFKKYDLNVTRVPAVDGSTLSGAYCISLPELGCLLSHIMVFEDILKNDYQVSLIFEDDFELLVDWKQKLHDAFTNLPSDWDMLYLGCKHVAEPSVIHPTLYRVNGAYTSSAYIIKKQFAEFILPHLKLLRKQIDVYFKEFQVSGHMYAVKPCISWQWANHSDIQDCVTDTKFYFKKY